ASTSNNRLPFGPSIREREDAARAAGSCDAFHNTENTGGNHESTHRTCCHDHGALGSSAFRGRRQGPTKAAERPARWNLDGSLSREYGSQWRQPTVLWRQPERHPDPRCRRAIHSSIRAPWSSEI